MPLDSSAVISSSLMASAVNTCSGRRLPKLSQQLSLSIANSDAPRELLFWVCLFFCGVGVGSWGHFSRKFEMSLLFLSSLDTKLYFQCLSHNFFMMICLEYSVFVKQAMSGMGVLVRQKLCTTFVLLCNVLRQYATFCVNNHSLL